MDAKDFQEKIVSLSDRDHVLLRPGMYIGGVSPVEIRDFFLEKDKFVYTTKSYVPGLIKIIFEAIDNSVDVAIKSNFEYANKISVTVKEDFVSVKDNGYGISQDIDPDTGLSQVILAVGRTKSGSNFDESKERRGVGTYGVGVSLTNIFSKEFTCETNNGESKFIVTFKDNCSSNTFSKKSYLGKPGTTISFYPDFSRFKGIDKIDDIHMAVIMQRLLILSVSYPEIDFTFNGKSIKINDGKKFSKMFGENGELYNFDNGFIAFYPTTNDEFCHYTIINGHIVPKGGSHVEYVTNRVVNILREKFVKRYKDIKPSDIRNKMMLVSVFRKFPNPEYEGQTKAELRNAPRDVSDYLTNVDFDKYGKQILRNKEITELITDMYRIKEEFQKQKDMQKISNKKGKVKSDKYREPVGDKKYLLIVEGDSALGGLLNEIGRRNVGYFAIKGKILNVLEEKLARIADNTEVDSIIKILEAIPQHLVLNPTGQYYTITPPGEEASFVVHETDSFKNAHGKWMSVNRLNNDKYNFEKIERTKIDPIKYFVEPRVNQAYECSYEHIVAAMDADNDGCVRGDTPIPSLDGNTYTMEELVKSNTKSLWVYSKDKDGKVAPAIATNPRITRYVTDLVELVFADGKLVCTPDHPILLNTGEYKEAALLTKDDSISSIYFERVHGNKSETSPVYEMFKTNLEDKFVSTARYVKNFFDPLEKYNEVHHIDRNSLNNTPDNLYKAKDKSEHSLLHIEERREQFIKYNKDPEKRDRISKLYSTDPKYREPRSAIMTAYNKTEKNRQTTVEMNRREDLKLKWKMIKISRYVGYLIDTGKDVNENTYNAERGKFAVVSWQKALSLFNTSDELIKSAEGIRHYTAENGIKKKYDVCAKYAKQILNIATEAYSKFGDIDESIYTTYKLSVKSKAPMWKNIPKYFGSIEALVETVKKNNHRVLSINKITLEEAIPVYDMTVDKYHNYLVGLNDNRTGGIIIHNCHIRALILTLFHTLLLPILKAGKVKYLNTPLVAHKTKGKIDLYFFDLKSYHEYIAEHPDAKSKGEWKYYKGLGSWAKGELKGLIEKEGLERFLTDFVYDQEAYDKLYNWMSTKTADYRKEHIKALQLDAESA